MGTTRQGTEELAQGTDRTTIVVDVSEGGRATDDCAWQDIIRSVLPHTFDAGAEERHIAAALASVGPRIEAAQGQRSPEQEQVSRRCKMLADQRLATLVGK